MTATEFRQLSDEEQQEIVARKGVTLSILNWHHYRAFLFAVEGFYVEYFFHQTTGDLRWTNVFEETELLSKYLDQIDISQLLPN